MLHSRQMAPRQPGERHARNRLRPAACRDHDGASAGSTRLRAGHLLGGATSRSLSRPRLVMVAESDVLGQLAQTALLLSQVPQPRQPVGTVGRGPQSARLRGRVGPLSGTWTPRPVDGSSVNQPEQKRRGTGTWPTPRLDHAPSITSIADASIISIALTAPLCRSSWTSFYFLPASTTPFKNAASLPSAKARVGSR